MNSKRHSTRYGEDEPKAESQTMQLSMSSKGTGTSNPSQQRHHLNVVSQTPSVLKGRKMTDAGVRDTRQPLLMGGPSSDGMP